MTDQHIDIPSYQGYFKPDTLEERQRQPPPADSG